MPPSHGAPPTLVTDRIERGLARLVPDARDRAFVLRCVLGEGPLHHRLANHALLTLLLDLVDATGAPVAPPAGVPVPMRLPPHLRDGAPAAFPVTVDPTPLRRLGDPAPWIDAVVDGPPHHALANALMVDLLGAVLAHLERA